MSFKNNLNFQNLFNNNNEIHNLQVMHFQPVIL